MVRQAGAYMVSPDFKLTSEMFWQGALAFALVDAGLVFLLTWRVQPYGLHQLPWAVAELLRRLWQRRTKSQPGQASAV